MKSADKQGESSKNRILRRLWANLPPKRCRQLAVLSALMLLGAMAELVTLGAVLPFLTLLAEPSRALEYPAIQRLSEHLGWTRPDALLLPATLLFMAMAISAGGVRILLAWASNTFIFGLGHDIGVEVYRRTLYQPYTHHVARNTSETLAAINKVQIIIQGFMLPAMQAVLSLVIAGAILFGLFAIDPIVAGSAGIGLGGIYICISVLTRQRLRANSKITSIKHSKRLQAVQEGLGGIRDVLLDGAQPVYVKRFAADDRALRDAQAVNSLIGALPKYLLESLGMVVIAVMAYFISQREGGLTTALPVMGALAFGGQKLIPLMQQVYLGWTKTSGNHYMLSDVLAVLEQPIDIEMLASSDASALPFERSIELRAVNYEYRSTGPKVLVDINLTIPKGRCVGFIGKTGSGKSTLLDILMGLLPVVEGQLLIDGQPLTSALRRAWQGRIAHVPQSIFLSDASIAENIAFGVPLALIDRQRLHDAAANAQILDYIDALPDRFDTAVGERGVRLSGGQRQRIGIARALYKCADVLVLDEATSALDDATERAVIANITKLGGGITVVMIAHRLTTLKDCDLIVSLSQGRITEIGTPQEIIPIFVNVKQMKVG